MSGLSRAVIELRRGGHRLSAPRMRVLEALDAADRPVSASEIAAGLGGTLPPCDDASVYRALELLVALGLTQELQLGHGPSLYAMAAGGERDYLVCESCRRLTAVDPRVLEPVRAAIARTFGWRVSFSHIPLAGTCPACATEPAG